MSLGYTWRRQVTRARLSSSVAGARLWRLVACVLACACLCLCPGAQLCCHVRPVGRDGLPFKEPATWGQGRRAPLMPPSPQSFWSFHAPMQLSGRCPLLRRCPSLVGDPAAEEWSPWSVCSLTCGQGLQVRTRSCVSSPYGTLCSGPLRETRLCNNSATCPGRRPLSCPICQQSKVLSVTGHNTAPPTNDWLPHSLLSTNLPVLHSIPYPSTMPAWHESLGATIESEHTSGTHSGHFTPLVPPSWSSRLFSAHCLILFPSVLPSPAPLAASQLFALAYSCPSPPLPHPG